MDNLSDFTKDLISRLLANSIQLKITSDERESMQQSSQTNCAQYRITPDEREHMQQASETNSTQVTITSDERESMQQASEASSNHNKSRQVRQLPGVTCSFWAKGKCAFESTCHLAHTFFPTVVHCAHRHTNKTVACRVQNQGGKKTRECAWPAHQCGYAHPGETSAMVIAIDVENRLEELPYRTLCIHECKLCCKRFDSLEAIRGHCDGDQRIAELERDNTNKDHNVRTLESPRLKDNVEIDGLDLP